MFKFKVTNITKAPRFLAEIGRLLQSGESTVANKLDAGTRTATSVWKIEEGSFTAAAASNPAKKKVVKDVKGEEDDELAGVSPSSMTAGPATLVDAKTVKRSVPLAADDADTDGAELEVEEDTDEPGEKVLSGGSRDEDLDDLIPSASKPVEGDNEPGGLVDANENADAGNDRE